MSVAPGSIGYNGSVTRQMVLDAIERINTLLLDPSYVQDNNKALSTDPEGTLKFQFIFEGQVNESEITEVEDGWVADGWDEAVCSNFEQSPTESTSEPSWSFLLVGNSLPEPA